MSLLYDEGYLRTCVWASCRWCLWLRVAAAAAAAACAKSPPHHLQTQSYQWWPCFLEWSQQQWRHWVVLGACAVPEIRCLGCCAGCCAEWCARCHLAGRRKIYLPLRLLRWRLGCRLRYLSRTVVTPRSDLLKSTNNKNLYNGTIFSKKKIFILLDG